MGNQPNRIIRFNLFVENLHVSQYTARYVSRIRFDERNLVCSCAFFDKDGSRMIFFENTVFRYNFEKWRFRCFRCFRCFRVSDLHHTPGLKHGNGGNNGNNGNQVFEIILVSAVSAVSVVSAFQTWPSETTQTT